MLIIVPTGYEAQRLLDGPVPVGETAVSTRVGEVEVRAALCGFGPAAAGVLAALALLRERPGRCLLVGICGTFDDTVLPVGALFEADEVRMVGVGRGEGRRHRGPGAMGVAQVPAGAGAAAVVDGLPLSTLPGGATSGAARGVLLTVPCAATTSEEAAWRQEAHPDALAEDMEGFPVALACARLGVGLTILRGVSNLVGETDWDREAALEAARGGLAAWLARA